jgi:hypothetical protein
MTHEEIYSVSVKKILEILCHNQLHVILNNDKTGVVLLSFFIGVVNEDFQLVVELSEIVPVKRKTGADGIVLERWLGGFGY